MAIRWATLCSQIQALLSSVQSSVAEDDLMIYANWALDTLTSKVQRPSDVIYEGDSVTTEFTLPDNLYEIRVIEWTSGEYAEEYIPVPGEELPTSANATPAYWRDENQLTWNVAPTTAFTVHYGAYWDRITGDDDEIAIPRWAEQAIAFYTGHLALLSQSAQSDDIGQWDQKMDSGQPEHNPLARAAQRWLAEYERIIESHVSSHTISTWRR